MKGLKDSHYGWQLLTQPLPYMFTCLVDGGQTRGSESDLVVLASAVCTALAAKGVDLTGSGMSSRP